jgi:hypothetical protein
MHRRWHESGTPVGSRPKAGHDHRGAESAADPLRHAVPAIPCDPASCRAPRPLTLVRSERRLSVARTRGPGSGCRRSRSSRSASSSASAFAVRSSARSRAVGGRRSKRASRWRASEDPGFAGSLCIRATVLGCASSFRRRPTACRTPAPQREIARTTRRRTYSGPGRWCRRACDRPGRGRAGGRRT